MGLNFHLSELHFNKANSSDIEATFQDLHMTTSDVFVSSKIYDQLDGFDFYIVNFLFLDSTPVPEGGGVCVHKRSRENSSRND